MDPQGPTQTSLRADDASRESARKPPSGAFTPDAPTKIMPPTPSLEGEGAGDGPEEPRGGYRADVRTQAMNLGGLLDDDPFSPRATDAEMSAFSSDEAEGPPLLDVDEGARVDLRAPVPRGPAPPSHDDDAQDVVEISLSDMESLPELADDDSQEDTHDTVVNLPLPPSLQRDAVVAPQPPQAQTADVASAKRARQSAKPPLPVATVVERRSHSPAALFDEDTASVTDPERLRERQGNTPRGGQRRRGPGDDEAPSPVSMPAEAPAVAVDAPTRSLASERTAPRPSLVSQPSGDPHAVPADGRASAAATVPVASAVPDEAGYWEDPSIVEADAAAGDETIAPDLSDVSHDDPPPLLHKWKVVPTAIKQLDSVAPAPAAAGSGGGELAKKLQTVLWSPDDEAAARAEHAAAARARNPFWAPTDVGVDVDDEDPLESTEAAAPSDPFHAAAAYVHDALAYLRSLSHFSAHLGDDVRQNFDARMLGATEKLRRALTVLQSGADEAADAEGGRAPSALGGAATDGLAPDASDQDDDES